MVTRRFYSIYRGEMPLDRTLTLIGIYLKLCIRSFVVWRFMLKAVFSHIYSNGIITYIIVVLSIEY
nr:hypothetical protein Q903MT_gene514 [Picea sitchensis]